MEISKLTLGAATIVCIAAGAGGAYLLRSNTPAAARDTVAAPSAGVEASEAMVTTTPPVEAPTVAPAPAPAVTAAPSSATRTTGENRTVHSSRVTRSAPAPTHGPAPRPGNVENGRQIEPPRDTRPAPQQTSEPIAAREPTTIVPPAPQFDDLVLTADSVIGLEVETSVTSERARVEDEVVAKVTRDVKVGNRVAIPSGARAHGEVTLVDRGGRMKDRARLGIRFTSIVLADGTRVPIDTDVIMREGSSPTGESTAKIGGGALGGAIIGGILGGAKGAIIGSSAGAGAGTAAVMAGGRNAATLTSGTPVTVRLTKPATVTVEK